MNIVEEKRQVLSAEHTLGNVHCSGHHARQKQQNARGSIFCAVLSFLLSLPIGLLLFFASYFHVVTLRALYYSAS